MIKINALNDVRDLSAAEQQKVTGGLVLGQSTLASRPQSAVSGAGYGIIIMQGLIGSNSSLGGYGIIIMPG